MALKRVDATATRTTTTSAADRVAAKQQEIKDRKAARAAEAAAKVAKAAPKRRIQVVSHTPVQELPCPACSQRTRYLKHASWCPKNTDRR